MTTTPVDRYLPVARLGWDAQLAAEQAYYIAQTSRPGEFRGVWLQQAGDLRSWGWERTISSLRENNIDAIFINVVNGGYANYPSRIIPHVTNEGQDPLADVLAWCRALGVQCHVWMMCNYIRPLTPPDRMTQLRMEGRLQETRDGRELPWLRPADPRNTEQLAAVAREIAQRYPVDGIHLDYIRYGQDADYSEAERDAFERALGRRIANWPADVEVGGHFRTAWATWRQGNVNRQVEAIADTVRAVRPAARISAAVYPIWTDARFKVAQDPETWARNGWMDFLCPMNYHTDDTTFYRYLAVQQRAVGKHIPLYPGIAAWRQESPADTISQIRRLRAMDMPGYLLFHLDRRLAREWLPAMRLGVTATTPRLGPAAIDPTEVAVGGHG